MKITVKTAGLLGKHLPAGTTGNAAELDMPEGCTPLDVMSRLGMSPEKTYLVVLNGTVVTKAERGSQQLANNDSLAIMPPLKGG